MTYAKWFRVTVVYGYVSKHCADYASSGGGPDSPAWWAGMLLAFVVLNVAEFIDMIERAP